MEGAEDLELLRGDGPVAVDAERTPGDDVGARHEEIGGEVEAVLHARRNEEVELGHLVGIDLRAVRRRGRRQIAGFAHEPPFVVVDADGVVAHAGEVGGDAFGLLPAFGQVGGAAKVDAVKALRDAGPALEFKVAVARDHAAELAGRLVAREDGGKVERRSGLDPRLLREGDPVGACDDAHGLGGHERRRLRPRIPDVEDRLHGVFAVGFAGAGGKKEADAKAVAVPVAVVLQEDGRGLVEGDAQEHGAVGAAQLDRRGRGAEQMALGAARGGDGDFGAVDDGCAAADARHGDVGADERLGEAARLVGRGAPFGVDAAVGGFREDAGAAEYGRRGGGAGVEGEGGGDLCHRTR